MGWNIRYSHSSYYKSSKRALRIISKKPFLHHTNHLFIHSRILKFKDVYRFRVCEYFYNGNLRVEFIRIHSHNTRYRSSLLPSYQRLTGTLKSLNYIDPRLWNVVPNYIKESNSLYTFKNLLKNNILESYSEI